jgi:hypothetical protein
MLLEWLALATAPLIVWILIATAPPIVQLLAEGTRRLVEGRGMDELDEPLMPGPAPVSAGPVIDGPARTPRGPLGLWGDRTHGREAATRQRD